MQPNYYISIEENDKMDNSTAMILLGVVVYVIGMAWLVYLDVRLKYYFNPDNASMNNRVAWAVFIALLGLILAIIGGVMGLM